MENTFQNIFLFYVSVSDDDDNYSTFEYNLLDIT